MPSREALSTRARDLCVASLSNMAQSYLSDGKMTEAETALRSAELVKASGNLDSALELLMQWHGGEKVTQAAFRIERQAAFKKIAKG